jgi:hypothetical protein
MNEHKVKNVKTNPAGDQSKSDSNETDNTNNNRNDSLAKPASCISRHANSVSFCIDIPY